MKKNIFKKGMFSILIIVVVMSCKENDTKRYYYDTGELLSEVEYDEKGLKDGELREYYKTGELKTKEYYKNNKLIDTTFGFDKKGKLVVKRYEENGNSIFERYYENGKLLSRGKMRDTIAEGWWNYYGDSGNLNKKVQYVDASNNTSINNVQHPNQIISFDKNGSIIKDSSNYYTIDLKDTIALGKLSLGYIDLKPQISKDSDFHMVYFWSENDMGSKTAIDSTYGKNDKKAEFWLVPKTKGKHTLKGYILENGKTIQINEKDTSLADVIYRTKKLLFEKDFYVKDTVPSN